MAWEPAHEGYANRSRHDPSCPSTPATCECGATDLWALSDEEEALGANTGKWMFFCSGEDAESVWALVAEATRDGELGWGSKCSLKEPKKPALMCFTRDHTDQPDRERVRQRLRGLLLAAGFDDGGVNLRYKADEATRAGIYSREDVGGRGGGRGGGAGGGVSAYHDVRERCRFIDSPRGCRNGAACAYSHDD